MKKTFYVLSFVAIAAFITSCEKAAALLFQPFESPLNFSIAIDPVVPGVQSTLGSSVVSYNLDAEVRAATNDAVGADFIKQIYVNEIAINLNNADASNNLGTFETINISFTAAGTAPVEIGPFAIPASTNAQISIPVTNSPNLRPFFNGNNVSFTISGKARSATTKTLNAAVSATLKFDK